MPWYSAGAIRALVGVGSDGTAATLVNRTMPGVTPFHGMRYTTLGRCFSLHRFLPTARLGQGMRYRITLDAAVPFHLDGDPVGELPLEMEIIPNRFLFLAPR